MRQEKYKCCKACKDPGYGRCVPLGRYCQKVIDELEDKIEEFKKDDPLNSYW